jgi:hypothetical protein
LNNKKIIEIFGNATPKVYKPKTIAAACSGADQVVGVEIEVERCAHSMDHYQINLSKAWEVKTDGSLRGNAFEYITRPMSLGHTIPELATFYATTGFTQQNFTDRTSIHVHANVTDMTVNQVSTLFMVYSVLEELLFEFVNKYKWPDKWGASRDTNLYSVPWNQCRVNKQVVRNLLSDPSFVPRNWHKYTALNLAPIRTLGTVEWRHMHGSADMEKITKWLNIIGSIMDYSKKNEFKDVQGTINGLNDTSAYRQFFTAVLQEHLPFEDHYTTKLASGVVNAKYALIDPPEPTQDRNAALVNHLAQLNAAAFRQTAEAAVPLYPLRAMTYQDRARPAMLGEPQPPLLNGVMDASGAIYDNRGNRLQSLDIRNVNWSRNPLDGTRVHYVPGFGTGNRNLAVPPNWRPGDNLPAQTVRAGARQTAVRP